MLDSLEWLTLEVKYLAPVLPFYTERLALPVVRESVHGAVLGAGDTELRLWTPGPVPRGGLHVHFAFSTPANEYDEWWNRLEDDYDLVEHEFGTAKSLYLYDPEENCVEIGQANTEGSGITGIFEIVLEVEELQTAEAFYRALGGELVSRGERRKRVRLDMGPVDLELWEPHLGLADARGGVHVDIGFTADDPAEVAAHVADAAPSIEPVAEGVRIRDPDGHYLTIGPN